MSLDALKDLCRLHLRDRVDELEKLVELVRQQGWAWLEIHFASLPRRFGRQPLGHPGDPLLCGVAPASLWPADLAAARLLEVMLDVTDDNSGVRRLFDQGDELERRMILKSLNFLDPADPARELLLEAHRSNDETLFRAAFADSHLAARILDDDDYHRAVLKAAFMNLELDRLFGAADRASPDLSNMLLEFMSEREAAGRPTWPGSLELAAHAPGNGVLHRVLGDLYHGNDKRRAHAIRAAAILMKRDDASSLLRSALNTRLSWEKHDQLRADIKRLLS